MLDTYEAERLPVARRLLETTDRAFAIVVSDRWISRILRTRVIARIAALAMRFNAARQLAFRTISQIGIRYRASRLSDTAAGLSRRSPQPGDRFPWMRLKFSANTGAQDLFEKLDDRRFNLVVFGQPAPSAASFVFRDILQIHEIPDSPDNHRQLARAGVPERSFYLLRPDGHIGVAGAEMDIKRIERYFAERVGLRDGGSRR